MARQSLEDFVESVSGDGHLRIEHDFGDGYVRLRTSEAERRQAAQDIRNVESVVLELLRNSRDAHAQHIFVATSREGDYRNLVVIDDGDGIPASMHQLVFEPRVTSKLDTNHMDAWGMHGRGMALFSVKTNVVDAYIADSQPGLGCAVYVRSRVADLPERNDQSSFPTFELTESGSVNVRGPRNILRTACEFAIETRESCSVFVGSPVDVAATLYQYGTSTLSAVDRAFCHDVTDLPLTKRLATAGDPDLFAEIAHLMGLSLSSRSARRIMDGEIPPLPAMLDRISIQGLEKQAPRTKKSRKGALTAKSLKLDAADSKALAKAAHKAFGEVAGKYYLKPDVEPRVRVGRDSIIISIPAVEDEDASGLS